MKVFQKITTVHYSPGALLCQIKQQKHSLAGRLLQYDLQWKYLEGGHYITIIIHSGFILGFAPQIAYETLSSFYADQMIRICNLY